MEFFEYGQKEIEYLKSKDKKLGAAIDKIGMIKREINPEPFTALVSSIVRQQKLYGTDCVVYLETLRKRVLHK